MNRAIVAIALVVIATSARAGGSFSVEVEFAQVRAQIPALWRSLISSFDLGSTGSANMIGNNVNERLGHRRLGPYCLAGKPKGQTGPDTLLFCFNTEYLWLDANGNKSSPEMATDLKENFMSLEITPIRNR